MQRRVTVTIDETAFVQLVELARGERRSARDQCAYLLEQALTSPPAAQTSLTVASPKLGLIGQAA